MTTSLSVGNRSRLVLPDEPSARVSASRSAGEGAKARIDSVENTDSESEDGGCKILGMLSEDPVDEGWETMLSNEEGLWPVPNIGNDFLNWKTLASGLSPFFSLCSRGEENHRRCVLIFSLLSDSRVRDRTRGSSSEGG